MSRSLRIAMFVGCFPVISETFILRQITGLLDLGHQVDIYADTRADGDAPVHPEIADYDLMGRATFMDMPPESAPWEMPVRPFTGRTWIPGSESPVLNAVRVVRALPQFLAAFTRTPALALRSLKQSEFAAQAASLSALHRVAKLGAQRRHYDVLHAHFGPVGNSFRFARELWRAPFMVTFHGYDFCVTPRKEGKAAYRGLFRSADLVTVNCDYAGGRLTELGCPPERIRKLHVGVDAGEFSRRDRSTRTEGPIRLVSVGRLVQKKGFEFALRAVASVHARHPKIRYEIIGDGPLRAKLEALAVQCGLKDAVVWHGARDARFVRERMASADVFLLPSVTANNGDQEGTPVSLMEAQAMGLPVVSSKHSGIPEVVLDGACGFLVPEGDVAALAEKIAVLMGDPELRAQFGARGREHVEAQFDLRQLNRELVEIYRDVIGRFGSPTQ